MRRVTLLLFLITPLAFGQALRYDSSVWTINQSAPVPDGLFPVIVAPGSQVSVCNAPVGGVSCVTLATTYNDAAEDLTCPTSAPLTRPNSNACVAYSDTNGALGVWVAAGCYQWVATTSYGQSVPQDFCIGAAGGSPGITQLTGDVTAGPGSGSQSATLAMVNSAPGTCGDAIHVCDIVVNGKGLITAQSPIAITFPTAGTYYQIARNNGVDLTQQTRFTNGPGITLKNAFGPPGNTEIDANVTTSNSTLEPFVVSAAGNGTLGHYAQWDVYGGIATGPIVQDFTATGCAPAASTDSGCTGSITISPAFADASYVPQLTINSINGAFLAVSVSGSLAANSIPYTVTCTFNCGTIVAPTIYVHAVHP